MFPKVVPIDSIKPADYNPRKINEKQFEKLKYSLKKLGCVIPVLVNEEENIIIAGHQRSKALKSLGETEVPVFYVKGVSAYDEARFNQFHNGIDLGSDGEGAGPIDNGFCEYHNSEFEVTKISPSHVKLICQLMNKYGNVLSCVVDDKGKIVYGGNYVKACKLLGFDVNMYGLSNNEDKAFKLLHDDYGEFSYENLEKETFVQGLAQMHRLKGKKKLKSTLYEKNVIPYLKQNKSNFLDFGAGEAAYAKLLGGTYVEFFMHKGDKLLVNRGHKMIDDLKKQLNNNGRFDLVVCDSVVNSTDSMDAEMAVLRCLNIFAKKDVFVSGRTMESAISGMNSKTKATGRLNRSYFMDENGFSGSYRKGHWFYQHFHTKETFRKEVEDAGFKLVSWNLNNGKTGFQAKIEKVRELTPEEAKSAIDFEFNLPLPNNRSYNRHKDVWEVVRKFYE